MNVIEHVIRNTGTVIEGKAIAAILAQNIPTETAMNTDINFMPTLRVTMLLSVSGGLGIMMAFLITLMKHSVSIIPGDKNSIGKTSIKSTYTYVSSCVWTVTHEGPFSKKIFIPLHCLYTEHFPVFLH